MIENVQKGYLLMHKLLTIMQKWADKWIRSDAVELLESEGATPQGIKIIDELNRVYRQTGLSTKITQAVGNEAQRIYKATGKPVRILELGMRDGTQLKELSHFGLTESIPMELHGTEFRQNIVDLAEKRLKSHRVPIHCHYKYPLDLQSFPSDDFDIVFSTFVLHHLSYEELKQILLASFQISRYTVLHIDLSRSIFGIILLWGYYTLFGYRRSRHDAVLSCRRAYRRNEISALLQKLNLNSSAKIKYIFPFYWSIHRPFNNSMQKEDT